MGTKTISIMDDVYKSLLKHKKNSESFSDELRRILESKGDIMGVAGAWSDISENEAEYMKNTINHFGKKLSHELLAGKIKK